MTSTREERFRRGPLIAGLFAGGMGLFCLATGLNWPTIASMRTIDLVHLLATGAGLGVRLVGVILSLVRRRTGLSR